MKLPTRFFICWLLLCLFFAASLSSAADSGHAATVAAAQPFSASDFDWREMIPALTAASELPGDQGVKELLENSIVLRAYVMNLIRAECKADKIRCSVITDSSTLGREVTSRIDAIVAKEIVTQNKMAVVDYTLALQPFPFSEIAAYKSQSHRDAYLVLALAGHSYTSLRVKAKYGVPFDDDIFQSYGVYKYRVDNPGYRSEAVFEIDPTNDAVMKIALSVKPRKNHAHPKPAQPF
ncbi:MAG TPA: hypothetical protein VMF10_08140 [Candidatus Aquilonibacter sp.]|nr:hypothetical protein [Candidatus Aquilonibacter sp.]